MAHKETLMVPNFLESKKNIEAKWADAFKMQSSATNRKGNQYHKQCAYEYCDMTRCKQTFTR